MLKFDSIIFDLDGTLWDTLQSSVDILAEFKKKHSDITKDLTPEIVRSGMGLSFNDIVDKYYGYLDRKTAEKYVREVFDEDVKKLTKDGAVLYKGVEKTIKDLSSYCKLYIVSNCQEGYIEAFLSTSKLGKYFDDFESNGRTKLEKGDNIKLLIERNNCKKPVYVGDTIKDKEAAEEAKIPFVFASYGFGNVEKYDYKIDSFSDLSKIVIN